MKTISSLLKVLIEPMTQEHRTSQAETGTLRKRNYLMHVIYSLIKPFMTSAMFKDEN